jgi:hypothetical protein
MLIYKTHDNGRLAKTSLLLRHALVALTLLSNVIAATASATQPASPPLVETAVSRNLKFAALTDPVANQTVVSQHAKPRMTKQEVIAVARRAIEARFPWAASKHYQYDAFLYSDGTWGVYVPHPNQPDLLGGGGPNAKVRDRDGKVLKVYLAR